MDKSTMNLAFGSTEHDVSRQIEAWLLEWTSAHFELDRDRLGPDIVFAELGLDSVDGVFMISELEAVLHVPLSPGIFAECTTARMLAQHIARLWTTRTR